VVGSDLSSSTSGSRLVVLGSCGAWPEPGRACSGYVLEHAGFRIVIDLGYGTLARLLQHLGSTSADGVDAVVITHKHPDHMLDLHGLFRARWFSGRTDTPIAVYAAEGVRERLIGLEEDDDGAIDQVFAWHRLPGKRYQLGPFRLDSWVLPHFVPNAGVRFTADDLTVAYTGDTGPDPALAELGRDADLFIVEATDRHQHETAPAGRPRLHLTARDAGEAASAAGARRLMLSHFWPDNDRQLSREAASHVFDGQILLADEGLTVALD